MVEESQSSEATPPIDFAVLGHVELRRQGQAVPIRGRQAQGVLGVLALNVGKPVSADELIHTVWGEQGPRTARTALHVLISRLRAGLAAGELATRATSYVLDVDPERVDAWRFRALIRRAADADNDAVRRTLLISALGLWRGPALAGVPGTAFELLAGTLETERLNAVEERIATDLRLGLHHEVAAEAAGLVERHGLRERLIGLTMRAMAQGGRRADALELFRQTRRRLVDELGVEPGKELQDLHQRILNADEEPERDRATVPRHLPPVPAGFVGRQAEFTQLRSTLDNGGRGEGATTICAIVGTAGVGKTTLAVAWAHQIADRFPDGQLFIDMRGHGSDEPVTPFAAMGVLLRSLGISSDRLPGDLDGRSGLYRTTLAHRRTLIVLDNARFADQVRPLLPASPGSLVLVTSREDMAGLVVREGAHRISTSGLSDDDALALLSELVGAERVEAEAGACRELSTRCGHLPLALRILAERAADSGRGFTRLAAELVDEAGRLDTLDTPEDLATSIRQILSSSYRALPADAARLFRLLGRCPGPTFGLHAAANLTDTSLPAADRTVSVLRRNHLVEPVGKDRFRMHDLLRSYAAEQAEEESEEALSRLLDWYFQTARLASTLASPGSPDAEIPSAADTGPAPANYDEAMAWLEEEHANLVACVRADRPAYAWPLASTLRPYFYYRGHLDDWIATHVTALQAVRGLGERGAEAMVLTRLGIAYDLSGERELAVEKHRESMRLCEQDGDLPGIARAATNLGAVRMATGRYSIALPDFDRASRIYATLGHGAAEANALDGAGWCLLRIGRHDDARARVQRALRLRRAHQDRHGEASSLDTLCVLNTSLERHDEAIEYGSRALALLRELHSDRGAVHALCHLGAAYARSGRLPHALERLREALTLAEQLDYTAIQAEVHNEFGEAGHAFGATDTALSHHRSALLLATSTDNLFEAARAHTGIGHALALRHQPECAREQWSRAAEIYTELGLPDSDVLLELVGGR